MLRGLPREQSFDAGTLLATPGSAWLELAPQDAVGADAAGRSLATAAILVRGGGGLLPK